MFACVDGIERLRKLRPCRAPLATSVIEQRPSIEYCSRQSQQKAAAPPVGGIDMSVEVAFYPVERIAFEVTPVIFIDEARGRDRRARGAASQLSLLLPGKRSVDCGKFVVLVFAHVSIFISGAAVAAPGCGLLNFPAFDRPLQKPMSRAGVFYPISHCPITCLALVPHPKQAWMPCVDEVEDTNIGFCCVLAVQSSSVLLKRTFP